MPPLEVLNAVGPVGAVLLIGAWWLQSLRSQRRNNKANPTNLHQIHDDLTEMNGKLDTLISRLDDVWDKVKG